MWKSNLSWEKAKDRARVIHSIRQFFLNKNIIEVETPILSSGTITDAYIEAFECTFDFYDSINSKKSNILHLQTSPEYSMKRLLASGYQSIYQLCKAFRHEEGGKYHNPEFTILEWYRVGFNHHQLINEVQELLQLVLNVQWCEKITYQDAFIGLLDVDPLDTDIVELKQALYHHGVHGDWIETETEIDILLQVLFSECIENKIGLEAPCFIYNYPVSQASLAKESEHDPRVSQRFECYFKGIELANGFNELTDVGEQIKRFELDNERRRSLGKDVKPIDENFVNALEFGLPSCAGVALGIDRLLMLAMEQNSIKEVMNFTIDNA